MHIRALFLALLPCSALAQDAAPEAKPKSMTEFAFNIGHALDNVYMSFGPGGYLRGSMSLLKNRGAFQYGVTLEGGTNSDDLWYGIAGGVANYRVLGKSGYWYSGAMLGYSTSGEITPRSNLEKVNVHYLQQGYAFGIQGGRVQRINRRFALSAELGVRSCQLWKRYTENSQYGSGSRSQVNIYVPVSFGFRCKL